LIIDSSAVLAILRAEPERVVFARTIASASVNRISAANLFEAAIVMDGSRDAVASRKFDEFIEESGVIVEPVSASQARLARVAYRNFGRGSGHPARLNFGDCFAYALAIETGEPLLFKGRDFGRTDVMRAVPEA
jgi:ribonuclease VapC